MNQEDEILAYKFLSKLDKRRFVHLLDELNSGSIAYPKKLTEAYQMPLARREAGKLVCSVSDAVEVTTPELQPTIVDEMLMLLSISGSANLQHRLRLLGREFSDIFSSTVRERPAVVPPLSMSVNKDRWADRRNRLPPRPLSYQRQGRRFKKANHLLLLGISRGSREINRRGIQSSTSST